MADQEPPEPACPPFHGLKMQHSFCPALGARRCRGFSLSRSREPHGQPAEAGQRMGGRAAVAKASARVSQSGASPTKPRRPPEGGGGEEGSPPALWPERPRHLLPWRPSCRNFSRPIGRPSRRPAGEAGLRPPDSERAEGGCPGRRGRHLPAEEEPASEAEEAEGPSARPDRALLPAPEEPRWRLRRRGAHCRSARGAWPALRCPAGRGRRRPTRPALRSRQRRLLPPPWVGLCAGRRRGGGEPGPPGCTWCRRRLLVQGCRAAKRRRRHALAGRRAPRAGGGGRARGLRGLGFSGGAERRRQAGAEAGEPLPAPAARPGAGRRRACPAFGPEQPGRVSLD